MSEFWQNKIKAFLHDPPDKALILFHKSHEERRDNILDELGLKYDKSLDLADHISSAMQRLDIPSEYRMDDARSCKAHICFKGVFKPVFKHTLSGDLETLGEIKDFIATYGYENALNKFGFDPKAAKEFLDRNDWKKTYFSLWRFLPEIYPLGYILPADTRIPDHSIWDHVDVTTAISSYLNDMGLLALKIPAVQEFISHSRKLSDLWASSHIFSTIIFEGIKVIAEKYGPDVIVYPQLRGNPMVDFEKFDEGDISFSLLEVGRKSELINERNIEERLCIANFPNTFLAFVPYSRVESIAKEVERKIKDRWKKIANEARTFLEDLGISVDRELWNYQIANAIEPVSVWLEFFNFDKFSDVKNEMPIDLKERQEKWLSFVEEAEKRSNYGYFYSLTYELLSIILAQKSRFWNAWEEKPKIGGKKCLMCGRRNALVERATNGDIYRYWNDEKNGWKEISTDNLQKIRYLLREGERLCAVCLTKRLYGWRPPKDAKIKSIFKKIFGERFKPPEQESVVHIAARDFIKAAVDHPILKEIMKRDIELIYEHEWGESEDKIPEEKRGAIKELSSSTGKSWKELKEGIKKSYEQFGKPNKYYAILMMDGDRIGKWLSGERWKEDGEEKGLSDFREFLHPVFKNEILKWEKGKNLLETQRILTPSYHIAISRAMKDFSLYVVPKIVEEYKGFLIYAGGDDVLALFPTDKVLKAAKELQKFFKMDFYEIEVNGRRRKVMGLGNRASMSAGIVFAHYKYPLYDVIEKVREVEKSAKNKYRRDAFCMTFIKRSGELLSGGGKWSFVEDFLPIIDAILSDKISHRFIYDFLEVIKILDGEMLKAETGRLLKRRKTEKATNEEINDICGKILCLVEKYKSYGLPIEDIGKILKILYDAYRGEEE